MGVNEAPRHAAHDAVRDTERGAARDTAVRVDIGELVLDGFDARIDPERVTAAFEAELTRLVRERGVPLAADGEGRALEALSGLPPLPATTSPARLGEALARAVHAGLSGRGEAAPADGRRRR
ncbi:hypothetical protein [Streptomyces radiopugnans]|uniref:Uncharacterized protein n=1 Tax=Streptomyces radiopugnans TaxID=403935 RepID=A0A1H9FMV6_9ACTN|nr:hypothetical protein [Streptomyces radiopugnans]SEQ39330.1 hypothetical protein SAMN05216481_10797 [Streptomyces radiopugnans]